MTNELTYSELVAPCIERINKLWGIHEPEDQCAANPVRCLAFLVDRRYVEDEGVEWRLGVSFGGNPFLPNVPRGFVPPPILPGRFIFGIHLVGTKDNKITLFDQFSDARQASDSLTIDEAIVLGRSILREMSDVQYARDLVSNANHPARIQISDRWQIYDFEVMPGEGFETEEERQAIKDSASSDYDKRWMAFFTPYSEKVANSHKKS